MRVENKCVGKNTVKAKARMRGRSKSERVQQGGGGEYEWICV